MIKNQFVHFHRIYILATCILFITNYLEIIFSETIVVEKVGQTSEAIT